MRAPDFANGAPWRTLRGDAGASRPKREGSAMEIETGDVVAVFAANGEVAYFGEVQSLHPGRWDAETLRGKVGILNPETGEESLVAYAGGEGFRPATEAESDDYISRWVDVE